MISLPIDIGILGGQNYGGGVKSVRPDLHNCTGNRQRGYQQGVKNPILLRAKQIGLGGKLRRIMVIMST